MAPLVAQTVVGTQELIWLESNPETGMAPQAFIPFALHAN